MAGMAQPQGNPANDGGVDPAPPPQIEIDDQSQARKCAFPIGFALYAIVSILAAIAVVFNALETREQFYPAIVHLATNKINVAVLGNLGLVFLISTGFMFMLMFFGRMEDKEVTRINDSVPYYAFEIIFALTVFREELSTRVISLFAVMLMSRVFHVLAEARVDVLQVYSLHDIWWVHVRLVFALLFLLGADAFLCTVFTSFVMQMGPTVLLMFAFEYAEMGLTAVLTAARFGLYAIGQAVAGSRRAARAEERARDRKQREEARKEAKEQRQQAIEAAQGEGDEQEVARLREEEEEEEANAAEEEAMAQMGEEEGLKWEDEDYYYLMCSVMVNLLKLVLNGAYFYLIFRQYGMPLLMIRDLMRSVYAFARDGVKLRTVLRMRAALPRFHVLADGDKEEVSDEQCPFCLDPVDYEGKSVLLPCGHVIHRTCLRQMVEHPAGQGGGGGGERELRCPYCRHNLRPYVDGAKDPEKALKKLLKNRKKRRARAEARSSRSRKGDATTDGEGAGDTTDAGATTDGGGLSATDADETDGGTGQVRSSRGGGRGRGQHGASDVDETDHDDDDEEEEEEEGDATETETDADGEGSRTGRLSGPSARAAEKSLLAAAARFRSSMRAASDPSGSGLHAVKEVDDEEGGASPQSRSAGDVTSGGAGDTTGMDTDGVTSAAGEGTDRSHGQGTARRGSRSPTRRSGRSSGGSSGKQKKNKESKHGKKERRKMEKEKKRREKAMRKAALGLGPLAAPSTPMGVHSIYQDPHGRRGSEVGSATESEYLLPGPLVGGGRGVSAGSGFSVPGMGTVGSPGAGFAPSMHQHDLHQQLQQQLQHQYAAGGMPLAAASLSAVGGPASSGVTSGASPQLQSPSPSVTGALSPAGVLSPAHVRALMRLPEAERERALVLLEQGEQRAREEQALAEEQARQLAALQAQQAAREQQAARDAAQLQALLAQAGVGSSAPMVGGMGRPAQVHATAATATAQTAGVAMHGQAGYSSGVGGVPAGTGFGSGAPQGGASDGFGIAGSNARLGSAGSAQLGLHSARGGDGEAQDQELEVGGEASSPHSSTPMESSPPGTTSTSPVVRPGEPEEAAARRRARLRAMGQG